MKSLFALVALSPLSPLAALAAEPEWNADANHCELYVDELMFTRQSVYGQSSEYFLIRMQTRAQDNVQNIGMFVRFQEDGQVREEIILADKPDYNHGRPLSYLTFYTASKSGGQTFRRTLERFAFFVDVASDSGSVTRLWLKDGSQDFSADALSRDKYNYSYPVGWGYGTAEYLWRDSGSPVFAKRVECAR